MTGDGGGVMRYPSKIVNHNHGSTFKQGLAAFLGSKTLDCIVLLLVIMDLGCVVVESGIDFQVLCINGKLVPLSPEMAVKTIKDDLPPSTTAPAKLLLSPEDGARAPVHFRRLGLAEQSRLGGSTRQPSGIKVGSGREAEEEEEVKYVLVCESKEGETARWIAHTAHTMSIYILVLFVIELGLKIWVHPKAFFASCWEVTDLIVVLVSLFFDLFEGHFEEIIEALVVIRFWRLVRIMHGFVEVIDDSAERYTERRTVHLENELKSLRERCLELEVQMTPKAA